MTKTKCSGCGNRKQASGDFCRSCQSRRHHAYKRLEVEGLTVDIAGGSWWVWDARGAVLVIGRDSKRDAMTALALGEVA